MCACWPLRRIPVSFASSGHEGPHCGADGWEKAMSETRIILVRHGETMWNREGRIQGYHANSPLSDTGHAQARAVAERLAAEGVDALYSSDSGRT